MYKLMKRIYLLLSLLLCSLLCMSQVSTSQNYISTRTYTSPDHSGCREQVVYFDGLGRPSQTVDCGITPDRKILSHYKSMMIRDASYAPGFLPSRREMAIT